MQQRTRKRIGSDEKRTSQDTLALPAELIARAAYDRYEMRGREDGHDVDDWLEAERQIRADRLSEGDTRGDES